MSKKTIVIGLAVVALIAATFCLPPLQGGMRRGGPGRGPAGALEVKSVPKSAIEKKVMAVINEMDKDLGSKFENVPYVDGQCLRLLTEAVDAKRVVEIGTSTGYSGLWFALALSSTGGKLVTHEINDDRIKMARDNYNKAGISDLITIVAGDAHQTVKQLKDPIDVLFIDADKEGYTDYLNKLSPLVRPGGLILAHNVGMRDASMADYVKAVTTSPDLETIFYEQGGGLSITLKKRSSTEVVKTSDVTVKPMDTQKLLSELKEIREPDVIFVPTPQEVVDKMLELVQLKKEDIVYDLGCGDGRIVVTAAKKFGCKAWGFDIDPRRIREAVENVEKNNVLDLVTIEQKDIFTLDLSKANVITLYLLPSLNVKLIPQLDKCKSGTRIVSHDFDMRGVTPEKVVDVTTEDGSTHQIYYWITPLKKEKTD